MTSSNAPGATALFASPFQIVDVADGVMLRRGLTRMHVKGETAREVVLSIVEACSPGGADRTALIALFPDDAAEPIGQLVEALVARRLLAPMSEGVPPDENETRADVFYWSFGATSSANDAELSARRLAIIGVNGVSIELARALSAFKFSEVVIVDHPLLRSVDYFDANGDLVDAAWNGPRPVSYDAWADADDLPDCIVTTSDFGGLSLMREWNAMCIREGVSFYPVVVHDLLGFAGPMVTPNSACFECFWLRHGSNLEDPDAVRATDASAFQGQLVDPQIGPIVGALANVAAFELARFYGRGLPPHIANTIIEVDLVGGRMEPRKILKAPRCPECSAVRRHSRLSIQKGDDMPGNDWSDA